MTVEFRHLSRTESMLITEIVARTQSMVARMRPEGMISRSALGWRMDMHAAHTARPLRLQELLDADDFNFAHDVFGIYRHLDRETGGLGGCFVPRSAIREGGAS